MTNRTRHVIALGADMRLHLNACNNEAVQATFCGGLLQCHESVSQSKKPPNQRWTQVRGLHSLSCVARQRCRGAAGQHYGSVIANLRSQIHGVKGFDDFSKTRDRCRRGIAPASHRHWHKASRFPIVSTLPRQPDLRGRQTSGDERWQTTVPAFQRTSILSKRAFRRAR